MTEGKNNKRFVGNLNFLRYSMCKISLFCIIFICWLLNSITLQDRAIYWIVNYWSFTTDRNLRSNCLFDLIYRRAIHFYYWVSKDGTLWKLLQDVVILSKWFIKGIRYFHRFGFKLNIYQILTLINLFNAIFVHFFGNHRERILLDRLLIFFLFWWIFGSLSFFFPLFWSISCINFKQLHQIFLFFFKRLLSSLHLFLISNLFVFIFFRLLV